ncbi:hypothetical protein SBI_02257 [Streptomyces bingchenggensis BCW-1]|uniref:Lipoprotein n=1 Tax=Streptomyces bingchenggensis (strain BCW-1) TaxID=749414 RepID=D7BUZ9_STRBB|nr:MULTISPECIES: hypothetical protein [Streptomyces]ADI05378.1 hypothetical protein SBI_02257 [Streptomyces bingchenggensis BCW-1]
MVSKRARWWAAALLAVGAVTGCSADTDAPSSPRVKGVPEVKGEKDLPALPLDSYRLSDGDNKRFKQAQGRLAQRCMAGLGFTDFPTDPKSPRSSASSLLTIVGMPTPLGPLDLDRAKRWGYGWEPKARKSWEPTGRAATDTEYAVLYGMSSSEATTPSGLKPPKGGCAGQANRQLLKGIEDNRRMWTYPSGRDAGLQKAVKKDRQVRRAFATWATCVVDKGGKRFADPMAAYSDKGWRRGKDGNTPHTRREVDTAVADVECKREQNTLGVWWAALAKRQRSDIQRNKDKYDAVRRDLDVLRGNIQRALG